jgi:hypothetical protein
MEYNERSSEEPNILSVIDEEVKEFKLPTPTNGSGNNLPNYSSEKNKYDPFRFRNSLRSRTSVFAEHVSNENRKKFEKLEKLSNSKQVSFAEKEELEKKGKKK